MRPLEVIGAAALAGAAYYGYQTLQAEGNGATSSSTFPPAKEPKGKSRSDVTKEGSSGFSVTQALRMGERAAAKATATVSSTGKQRTYQQVAERVRRAATGLKKLIGASSKPAPVAILSLNSDRYFEYLFVCPWAGAWVVPLNIRLAAPEIVDVLNDCEARVLFIDDAFAPVMGKLKAAVPSLKYFVYIGEQESAPEGAIHYEKDLIQAVEVAEEAADVSGDDVYGIFYTGGTTGKSKGVLLTHTNVMCNAYCIIAGMGYNRESRYLHAAPMFHLADGASTFALTMVAGTHVFIPKFTPQDTVDALEKHKVSHVLLVPTMISMTIKMDGISKRDLSSVKCVLYGASPIAEATLVEAMSVFSKSEFMQGYGMTETAPVNTILTAADHRKGGKLLKSAGRPVPHVELKVVDENDVEVAHGVVGELIVRGPHVMKGYYNMPEQTAHALKNGWMHTGDGAVMDEDGYIYIMDRIKDMIITGGENVYSVEVENAISKLPGVAMCAVIGTPDATLGEKVTAIVVPSDPSINEQNVMDHCKSLIAGYKCPRSVIIRQEPLPLSGAGKILKNELRKPFWEGKAHIYSDNLDRKTEYQ